MFSLTFNVASAISVLVLGVSPGVLLEGVAGVFTGVKVRVVLVSDVASRTLVEVYLAVDVGTSCAEPLPN